MISPRVPQPSAGEPLPSSTGGRGNHTLRTPKHGAVNTEIEDQRGDQVANAPRLVFVEFGRSGIAAPFQFFPFIHDGLNSQGARHDIA